MSKIIDELDLKILKTLSEDCRKFTTEIAVINILVAVKIRFLG
jgi:DNA-binding Lrp family transcriptional regulator